MALDHEWLNKQLQAIGMSATPSLFAGSDKSSLIVHMGEGADGHAQAVQLWLEPQELSPSETSSTEAVAVLHLFIPIGTYEVTYMPDVVGFLTTVNAGLEMPGFGLHAPSRSIYYRSYSFITGPKAFELVQALMGISLTYVDAFTLAIQAIACGKKTAQEAYKSLLEEGSSYLKEGRRP